MNRSTLTALYLDEVKRRGVKTSELIGSQASSDRLRAVYQGRYLPRPLFLGRSERVQLETDLLTLRAALVSLPDRLYGGNLAAFARDVGMNEVQISAIMRSRADTVTMQARADLYIDDNGFKLMEYNMGSGLGGMDNADMCRSLLEHPVLAEFAARHRLEYIDTMREEVSNKLAETGFTPGSRPMMVTTDWPTSYKTLEPYIRMYNARLQQLGIDANPCDIGQLTVHDNRVWLRDRAVDAIDRLFLIEDLLEYPDAPALVEPILDAAARGWVKIFTPLDSALYSSKGALAMLSDEANRSRFSAEELVSLDRILPWTRMARPGPVTLEDGHRVDMLAYALANQRDLVLKPTALHGGEGVLLGWIAPAREWEDQVRAAMDGPYVLQRRIRPVPELFPDDNGELIPWAVIWGAFTGVNGFGGAYIRAVPIESGVGVIGLGLGAHAGSSMFAKS